MREDSFPSPAIIEWLKLNSLEKISLDKFFKCALFLLPPDEKLSKNDSTLDISLDNVLEIIRDSFLAHLPALFNPIQQAFAEVEISLTSPREDLKPPYMIDRSSEGAFICIGFDGSARSIVNLAHEMAHVVQLYASKREQTPPLFREICAFIGEKIILEYFEKNNKEIHSHICNVIEYDDNLYLGADLDLLETALEENYSTYNYRWNYPIARYVANLVYENASTQKIEELFLSGKNAAKILPINDILLSTSPNNYLPKMPNLSSDNSAQAAYMQLGMMVMLDFDNKESNSKLKIETYYDGLLQHLQKQTAFIALDFTKKPIGYVTWDKVSEKSINLTYQTTPFADSQILLKSLRQFLPKKVVISNESLEIQTQEQSV